MTISNQRNVVNMAWAKPDVERLQKLNEEKPPASPEEQNERVEMLRKIYAKHDFNPSRMMLNLLQIPFQISYFFGIGKLAAASPEATGFSTGGLWWFTDLSVADPTYVLPAASAAIIAFNVEMGGDGNQAANDMARNMKMVVRAMAPLSFVFTCQFPTGVVLFLVASNLFSSAQVLAFKVPGVKASLGIRALPPPPKSPLEVAKQALATSENSPIVSAVVAPLVAPSSTPPVPPMPPVPPAPPVTPIKTNPPMPRAPALESVTEVATTPAASTERQRRARRRERMS